MSSILVQHERTKHWHPERVRQDPIPGEFNLASPESPRGSVERGTGDHTWELPIKECKYIITFSFGM